MRLNLPLNVLWMAVGTFASLPARAEIVLPNPPEVKHVAVPQPVLAPAPKAAPFSDRLVFADRDMLRGNLVSLSKDSLTWQHKDGLAPFQFKTSALKQIELASFAPKGGAPENMRVYLENGDCLYGQLVEYGPDKLALDTWYAGRISINPAKVRTLIPSQNASEALVNGFGKISDWRVSNGSSREVKINGDGMTLTGSVCVARELKKLPAKYRIDLAIADKAPQFQLAFLADTPQIWGGNSYTLRTNGRNSVYLQKITRMPNGGSRSEGDSNWRYASQEEDRFNLSMFVNMDSRTLAFVVNGAQVGSASIPADFKPGEQLVLMGQDGEVKFTHFAIKPWSGVLEASGEVKRPKADVLVLANRDQISGKLLGIKADKVSFKAEFATMDIPLDRISRFELAGTGTQPPHPKPGDVWVFLNESDRLTLSLEAVQNGRLTGKSDALGALSVEVAAIKQMDFKPDEQK